MPRRRVWRAIDALSAAINDPDDDFKQSIQHAANNNNDDRIVRMCRRDLGLNVIVVRDEDEVGDKRPFEHVHPVWIVLDVPDEEDD